MPFSEDIKWRLATTEAGLPKGSLIPRGVPAPVQAPYRDFTTRVSRGPGGIAKHGYKNDELLWTRMSLLQRDVIKGLVDAVGFGLIYATVLPTEGTYSGQWIDVSAYPSLEDQGPESPQSRVNGTVTLFISNVVLRLNNITVLNTDPTFEIT